MVSIRVLPFLALIASGSLVGTVRADDCCDIGSCSDHCCNCYPWWLGGCWCTPGCESWCNGCKDWCDWELPPLGISGQLISVPYGKALNLQGSQNHNGGHPNVWTPSDHPDQEWFLELIDVNTGSFRIRNPHYGKCLNLQQHQNFDDGRPNVWECVDHPDQKWQLFEGQIRNVAWGKCLNLHSLQNNDGGSPSVWTCTTHTDQLWYFTF